MRMPLISRILFTLSTIGLTVGAHLADLSPSHLFNDRWPPHAKFHTGQTLSMSVLLSLLTIFFAWRKTSNRNEAVLATAAFAATYWVAQATAVSYPNTGFFDPEFVTPHSFGLGLPTQAYFESGSSRKIRRECDSEFDQTLTMRNTVKRAIEEQNELYE